MMGESEPTPCGVMFDLLKTGGGIKHNELAEIVLSGRRLADGRSPVSHASDRSWLSRFVVHAPVASLQARYFADYSASALRIVNRLRGKRGRALTDEQIINLVCGENGHAMDRALAACYQDASLYRNALERLAGAEGHTAGERAEAVMVLFVAVGCSANVHLAVEYTLGCARVAYSLHTSTPSTGKLHSAAALPGEHERPFGLMRVEGGYIAGAPSWVDPASGVEVGALAMGERDITNVAGDVSGRHLRIWRDDDGRWLARDLGSKNGTVLVDGATGAECKLDPSEPVELHPGDELRLASSTTFVIVEGAPGLVQ